MIRKLTDRKVKAAKPKKAKKGKNVGQLVDTKYQDGGGLYLMVFKSGGKVWRFDYTLYGKRKTLTLGKYPAISLKEARAWHEKALEAVAHGQVPMIRHKASHTDYKPFSYYAEQTLNSLNLAPTTYKKRLRLEKQILYPILDKKPVTEITALDLLNICKRLTDAGKYETAKKAATYCRQVFDTILGMQLITINPAEGLKRLLPKPTSKRNYAHTTDTETIKLILKGVDVCHAHPAIKAALQMMPHVFLRPAIIRHLEWDFIDWEKRMITIPPHVEGMKRKSTGAMADRPHYVPMSEQVYNILQSIKPITGHGSLVFSTAHDANRPLGVATLNNAIARIINPKTGKPIGKGIMTGHGFRYMATTFLNNMMFNSELIERQMLHTVGNAVRMTYDKSEQLPERAKMMQAWSDYLDSLKHENKVISIGTASA